MKTKFAINYFSDQCPFVLKGKKNCSAWLAKVLQKESKIACEINYIFCNDAYLIKLNKTHLQHNTYTDIITFNYSGKLSKSVAADIYISVDRVKDNAKTFSTSFQQELNRVMVHGVLHLCGYTDKKSGEQKKMRCKEDFYLKAYLLISN